MKHIRRIIKDVTAIAAVSACAAANAIPVVGPADYTGSLTVGGGGITATEQWNDPDTSISWVVTELGDHWGYSYTWHTDGKDISHLLLQVSDGATLDPSEFWNFVPPGDLEGPSSFGPGGSNPGIPGSVYSIKFDNLSGTDYTVSFESSHSPTWGDFYAKDGKSGGPGGGNDVYAYNTGFLVEPDVKLNHIVVPNGIEPPPDHDVPDSGATLGLVGLALLGLEVFRRYLVR